MSRTPVPLSAEPLDGRVLPSSMMPVGGGPLPPVYVHPAHPLAGRGTGDYDSKRENPDTGPMNRPSASRSTDHYHRVTARPPAACSTSRRR